MTGSEAASIIAAGPKQPRIHLLLYGVAMNNPLGVIFDMDGVLIDTYESHFRSWQMMAAEAGLTISEEQFAATFGRTSREVLGTLWGPDRFSPEEISRWDARKEELFRELIAADFPAMPGVESLLRGLAAAGFALAIGSSAPPENVELAVDRLQMRGLFDAIVTGADVTRGKPDPQVFMTAAARLRIPPEWSAVVEDAPLGIAAAQAAGAASIALVSTGRKREQLTAADLVVDRLAELSPQRIEELILRHAEEAGEEVGETIDLFEDDTE